jgi:hypothetical protein
MLLRELHRLRHIESESKWDADGAIHSHDYRGYLVLEDMLHRVKVV